MKNKYSLTPRYNGGCTGAIIISSYVGGGVIVADYGGCTSLYHKWSGLMIKVTIKDDNQGLGSMIMIN